MWFSDTAVDSPRTLADYCIVDDTSDTYHTYNLRYTRDKAELAEKFIIQIYAIEGIKQVYPSRYTVGISIGSAYSWEEIEPKVFDLITKFVNGTIEEVIDPEKIY